MVSVRIYALSYLVNVQELSAKRQGSSVSILLGRKQIWDLSVIVSESKSLLDLLYFPRDPSHAATVFNEIN